MPYPNVNECVDRYLEILGTTNFYPLVTTTSSLMKSSLLVFLVLPIEISAFLREPASLIHWLLAFSLKSWNLHCKGVPTEMAPTSNQGHAERFLAHGLAGLAKQMVPTFKHDPVWFCMIRIDCMVLPLGLVSSIIFPHPNHFPPSWIFFFTIFCTTSTCTLVEKLQTHY